MWYDKTYREANEDKTPMKVIGVLLFFKKEMKDILAVSFGGRLPSKYL